jgi:hypothetical protein
MMAKTWFNTLVDMVWPKLYDTFGNVTIDNGEIISVCRQAYDTDFCTVVIKKKETLVLVIQPGTCTGQMILRDTAWTRYTVNYCNTEIELQSFNEIVQIIDIIQKSCAMRQEEDYMYGDY